MEEITGITIAVFVATAITAIVEYMKKPLVNSLRIRKWMLDHGWAEMDGEHVVMWWLTYVTFVLGVITSLVFRIDLVTPFVPDAPVIGSLVLTACIVGGGANIIHDVTKRG